MSAHLLCAQFFMKRSFVLLVVTLIFFSCKERKPFNAAHFMVLSQQHHLVTEAEAAMIEVNIASLPRPQLRSVAGMCKKISFMSAIKELGLQSVNVDSNFNYLKYFREQLSLRSSDTSRPPALLRNIDSIKANGRSFIRALYDEQQLDATQYAKISDQIRQEPVVYPFLIYEWIETMP